MISSRISNPMTFSVMDHAGSQNQIMTTLISTARELKTEIRSGRLTRSSRTINTFCFDWTFETEHYSQMIQLHFDPLSQRKGLDLLVEARQFLLALETNSIFEQFQITENTMFAIKQERFHFWISTTSQIDATRQVESYFSIPFISLEQEPNQIILTFRNIIRILEELYQ